LAGSCAVAALARKKTATSVGRIPERKLAVLLGEAVLLFIAFLLL
jgi:hypothetical protein